MVPINDSRSTKVSAWKVKTKIAVNGHAGRFLPGRGEPSSSVFHGLHAWYVLRRWRSGERREANVNSLMHLFIPLLEYFQSHSELPRAFCYSRRVYVSKRRRSRLEARASKLFIDCFVPVSREHLLTTIHRGEADARTSERLVSFAFPEFSSFSRFPRILAQRATLQR